MVLGSRPEHLGARKPSLECRPAIALEGFLFSRLFVQTFSLVCDLTSTTKTSLSVEYLKIEKVSSDLTFRLSHDFSRYSALESSRRLLMLMAGMRLGPVAKHKWEKHNTLKIMHLLRFAFILNLFCLYLCVALIHVYMHVCGQTGPDPHLP